MAEAVQIALLIFFTYTILAVNTIALAKSKYVPTMITATLFMVVNFFLIKHVADAKTIAEFLGYLIGGVSGDMMGIFISKKVV
jgi:uncharacterized membrane protein YjjB (DUF3815 family)